MGFSAQALLFVSLTGAVLVWAKWAKLDLGLRTPSTDGIGAWIAFCVILLLGEAALSLHLAADLGAAPLQGPDKLSFGQDIVLSLLIGPVFEELLFRGALLSLLLRRWGASIAIVATSAMWCLGHLHYPVWLAGSVLCSGILFGIIRLKSGSIYVPLALHISANALGMILSLSVA